MAEPALKAAVIALERANEALQRNPGKPIDLQPVYDALQGKASKQDIEALKGDLDQLGLSLSSKAERQHEHEGYALKSAVDALTQAVENAASKEHKHPDIGFILQQLYQLLGEKAEANHGHAELESANESLAKEIKQLDSLITDSQLAIELLGENKADAEHEHHDLAEYIEALFNALDGKAESEHEHKELESRISGVISQLKALDIPTLADIAKAAEKAAKPAPSSTELLKLIRPLIPEPVKGDDGDIGPMPKHEIKKSEAGVSIRFESEPGEWGEWVKIRYPQAGGGGISRPVVARMIEDAGTGGGDKSRVVHVTDVNYTMAANVDTVACTEAVTITLPATSSKRLTVKNYGTDDVTIRTPGSQLVERNSDLKLNIDLFAVDLEQLPNGDWMVV